MAIKIGDLAKRSGCEVVTIRYYEKEGLLPKPARSGGNFRLYNDVHIESLQFIRHCRSLDMSLSVIRVLLRLRENPTEDCGEVNARLDSHIQQVNVRVEALLRLRQYLLLLRRQCSGTRSVQACGILHELTDCNYHSS
ncbi:Cd(II)/Pb(II)-responsive transcriptional regulator [Shewanella baltica]|jgi:Cd(II)/Pb(II)-responsive transcriptional regulator|uniref:Cd(II)/Pb(II)-responsive transcriptional regulator n=1 Tax=Shewanella baltica TaxID=62322 RepID=UPI0021671B45|nr:Cd(II)/Pb(II)-responsive transcriptional regulator [Shewanella baltica]MCS6116984.1 Cd(II)/Pb(II)-responsive transcriptional regulator [Shewanella baltica]MCS6129985.1 Cd(II)/Pb(II)-responsive transcriptional regulator [Shewanella baltica]MCS6141900.1 Cd(II)/Pb(II)-responsive transcriptional regulator [Shewanella baltica]MCS6148235.1 Cd(II)/Pb(II)-responsive transcriptional regulator [Shewanella baltica]MCS6172788.1 Cd(II)/Pb(II)-responsive transcriptional regulator [Shewanella baltica]